MIINESNERLLVGTSCNTGVRFCLTWADASTFWIPLFSSAVSRHEIASQQILWEANDGYITANGPMDPLKISAMAYMASIQIQGSALTSSINTGQFCFPAFWQHIVVV